MISDCTALILAGGDSRRMGQDKATLLLDEKTMLEHVEAAMREVFPKVMVSVRQTRAGLGMQQVQDGAPGGGPLAGLVAGLQQAETAWIFAVACDMPFVTPALVRGLASLREDCHALVPVVQQHAQPLAAFYAKRALPVMQACLYSDERSVRGALKELNVSYVGEEALRQFDPQLCSFFDLDTPQDLQAAVAMRKR